MWCQIVTDSVAVFYDEGFMKYDLGPHHPLHQDRILLHYELSKAMGILSSKGVSEPDFEPASEDHLRYVHNQDYIDEVDAREAEKVSPERPISELELGTRATDALARADIVKVGQVMEMMETGEASLLAVEGFGRKSLADLKKRLRQFGYKLPEAVEEIQV